MSQRQRADAALLAVAVVWGATFVMVKDAVALVDTFTFLALRFGMAFVVLGLWMATRRPSQPPARIDAPVRLRGRPAFFRGMGVGIPLFLGYAFQTAGLDLTSATRAGFITGLAVVVVPFFAWIALRRPPTRIALLGALGAVTGVLLLSWPLPMLGGGPPGQAAIGDGLVLVGAVCFGLHIVAVGVFATRLEPRALATGQILFTAIASLAFALLFERAAWPPDLSASLWQSVLLAAAFTGVVATAFAFAIQTTAQAFTTPERTALIFSSEPLFAALFGVLLHGDILGGLAWAGGVLIVMSMALGALRA